MNKPLRSFLFSFSWTIPFFGFIAGYMLCASFFSSQPLIMPSLEGLTLEQALTQASEHQLTLQLLGQKEDTTLQPGTILSHTPHAGDSIKAKQTVFVVIAQQPTQQQAPCLHGMQTTEIETLLKRKKIRYQTVSVTPCVHNPYCIAQTPPAGTTLTDNGIVLYMHSESSTRVLCPDFTGYSVAEINSFLAPYGITPTFFHTHQQSPNHSCDNCRVTAQKPLAGSFINLYKPFSLQLKI